MKKCFILCAILYTLLWIGWRVLLQTSFYDSYWQLQVSQIFGGWSYLPLIPLILLGVWARVRWSFPILLLPAIFFASEYGRQYLPNWHLVEEHRGATVRVLSWNTLYTSDSEFRFIEGLRELQPDVVAIQEYSYTLARFLEEELAENYPYTYFFQPSSRASLGLLSRYPIVEVDVESAFSGCRCQRAILNVEGRLVTVINLHALSPSYRIKPNSPGVTHFNTQYQGYFFDALFKQIEAAEGPLLVLGDFNTTERQPNYRRLTAQLNDSFAQVGWGMGHTYPDYGTFERSFQRWFGVEGGLFPLIRIDHVFHNEDWIARSAKTVSFEDSDHRAIVVELGLVE